MKSTVRLILNLGLAFAISGCATVPGEPATDPQQYIYLDGIRLKSPMGEGWRVLDQTSAVVVFAKGIEGMHTLSAIAGIVRRPSQSFAEPEQLENYIMQNFRQAEGSTCKRTTEWTSRTVRSKKDPQSVALFVIIEDCTMTRYGVLLRMRGRYEYFSDPTRSNVFVQYHSSERAPTDEKLYSATQAEVSHLRDSIELTN